MCAALTIQILSHKNFEIMLTIRITYFFVRKEHETQDKHDRILFFFVRKENETQEKYDRISIKK